MGESAQTMTHVDISIVVKASATAVAGAVLAIAGWFALYRTEMIAIPARKRYEESEFHARHKSYLVFLRNWLPTLVQFAGLISWLVAIACFGLAAWVLWIR
jgi:hypothetical protein